MRKRVVDLTPAILKVLDDSSRPMAPIDISAEIAERKLAKLESEHYEQTYGMANFTHSVRSLLNYLQKQGKVRKVARARYELIRSTERPIFTEEDIAHEISEREINELPAMGGRMLDTDAKAKIYLVDEIKLEQANEQHRRFIPKRISRADLVTVSGNDVWLFEMKSLTEENERKQARTGIGQLFDYEFTELSNYRGTHNVVKALAFERQPIGDIILWLRYVGILVYWLGNSGEIDGEVESLNALNRLGEQS